MIAAHFDTSSCVGRIVLRPNHSWTWRANTYLISTLMVISGIIAIGFTLNGLWLVLPFTVLEMGVLTACLYYCVRRTHTMEVLTLSRAELVYEKGIRAPSVRMAFDRYFARFFVRPPSHPRYHKQVALRCRGEEVEVGTFLTDAEKDDLVLELRQMSAPSRPVTRTPAPASR